MKVKHNQSCRTKQSVQWPITVGISLALVVGLLALINVVGLWQNSELWSQILAACMGAIVVAVVTMLLMRGQRSSEEEKEKSITIYESKVNVYSSFVAKMFKLLADETVSCNDFLGLRTEVFSSLIFYLDSTHLRQLLEEIDKITDFSNNNEMLTIFARITNILQDDLRGLPYTPDDREQVLVTLWQRFYILSTQAGCTL